MPLDYMGANHLAPLTAPSGAGWEPQRMNNAILVIHFNNASYDDILRLSVNNFPIPRTMTPPLIMRYLNESRKVAGGASVDPISVLFKDFVTQKTAAILWAWRRQTYDALAGKIGMQATYKKVGYAELLAPDGSMGRMMKIEGMWLSSDPYMGEYSYDSEDVQKIECQIEIDKVYADMNDPYFSSVAAV